MANTMLTDQEIADIALGMLAKTLPKPRWTHAAHWASALYLLRHDRPRAQAMGAAICAYNESVGGQNTDTSGYHETITLASLRAAEAHLASYPPASPLSTVLADLLATPLGQPDWLLAYWSRDALFSVAARRHWLAPDLAPLPYPAIQE